MEVVRRVFMFLGHVQFGYDSRQLVDKLEMKRLTREPHISIHSEAGHRWVCRVADHISHSFSFDTTGHATRGPRSFDLVLVAFCEIPHGVVWMAENPEVISADVGEFLEIRLIYPGLV